MNALESAIRAANLSQAVFGRLVGARQQQVWNWLNRTSGIPPGRCPAIERALDARVTCEELRPDVRWLRVPDPAWPHPQGRPCIDVAAPAAEEDDRAAA